MEIKDNEEIEDKSKKRFLDVGTIELKGGYENKNDKCLTGEIKKIKKEE
ncbi:MAG: hypothetical protein ABIF85_02640 [Nanoarchaeota archaeon]